MGWPIGGRKGTLWYMDLSRVLIIGVIFESTCRIWL